MKFIKLHQSGKAFLLNMNNVPEVYTTSGNKSSLLFNFPAGDQVVKITVDESLDEVLELIKQVSE